MAITQQRMKDAGYATKVADGSIHNITPVCFSCKEIDRLTLDNSQECINTWGYIANSSVCMCFDSNTTYTWDEDVQEWV